MEDAKIISEVPLNTVAVRAFLRKNQKKQKELNYRANKTLEFLNYAVNLDENKAAELYDKLQNLKIPRLKDHHIHKIIDIQPLRKEEIKLIFQGYPITITQENMKRIADTVKDFVPAKKG